MLPSVVFNEGCKQPYSIKEHVHPGEQFQEALWNNDDSSRATQTLLINKSVALISIPDNYMGYQIIPSAYPKTDIEL